MGVVGFDTEEPDDQRDRLEQYLVRKPHDPANVPPHRRYHLSQ